MQGGPGLGRGRVFVTTHRDNAKMCVTKHKKTQTCISSICLQPKHGFPKGCKSPSKDPQLSCFFKKSLPLLGVDGQLDLDGTSYYSPPPLKEEEEVVKLEW